jgi:ATP-dependent Clp protease ATP-binding subunit ClpC
MIDKQLRAVQKEKESAVREQDFTKAGELRDKEWNCASRSARSSRPRKDDEAGSELTPTAPRRHRGNAAAAGR